MSAVPANLPAHPPADGRADGRLRSTATVGPALWAVAAVALVTAGVFLSAWSWRQGSPSAAASAAAATVVATAGLAVTSRVLHRILDGWQLTSGQLTTPAVTVPAYAVDAVTVVTRLAGGRAALEIAVDGDLLRSPAGDPQRVWTLARRLTSAAAVPVTVRGSVGRARRQAAVGLLLAAGLLMGVNGGGVGLALAAGLTAAAAATALTSDGR